MSLEPFPSHSPGSGVVNGTCPGHYSPQLSQLHPSQHLERYPQIQTPHQTLGQCRVGVPLRPISQNGPTKCKTARTLTRRVNSLPMGPHLALRFKLTGKIIAPLMNASTTGLKLRFPTCGSQRQMTICPPRREDPAVRRLLFVSTSPCGIFYASHSPFWSLPSPFQKCILVKKKPAPVSGVR